MAGRTTSLLSAELEKKKAETRQLTLLRSTGSEYPELYLRVLVVGPRSETAQFSTMLARAGCRKAKDVEDADLVIFSGGPDVDPVLYGEEQYSTTRTHAARDTSDIQVYLKCLEQGVPMFGVCRGAQFLWVMNGGKLYQDVDKHYGEHTMWDKKNKIFLQSVSSVHHQMCRMTADIDAEVIAESHLSTRRVIDNTQTENGKQNRDIEAFFVRETCCFGVQGHPEYSGYDDYTEWTLKMIQDLIIHNPDLSWVGKRLRIKKEEMELRSAVWEEQKDKRRNGENLLNYITKLN